MDNVDVGEVEGVREAEADGVVEIVGVGVAVCACASPSSSSSSASSAAGENARECISALWTQKERWDDGWVRGWVSGELGDGVGWGLGEGLVTRGRRSNKQVVGGERRRVAVRGKLGVLGVGWGGGGVWEKDS